MYQRYCRLIGIENVNSIRDYHSIPFLPIDFFKTQRVVSFEGQEEIIFYSSSTGGKGQSRHFVNSRKVYEKSFLDTFTQQFGNLKDLVILGLLPSYLEREGSSLIYMVSHLMKESGNALNGYFLFEHDTLKDRIQHLELANKPYILFGVSFALLDFARKFPVQIRSGKIIETGGMKGRKKEITRMELMHELQTAFQTSAIYSEYGMTELLSQAYAGIDGKYKTPEWMKVLITDLNDPFTLLPPGKTGILNIIDLANTGSCAFIQTSDLGRIDEDGSFEVLGRADFSDVRGCSLMVS